MMGVNYDKVCNAQRRNTQQMKSNLSTSILFEIHPTSYISRIQPTQKHKR